MLVYKAGKAARGPVLQYFAVCIIYSENNRAKNQVSN